MNSFRLLRQNKGNLPRVLAVSAGIREAELFGTWGRHQELGLKISLLIKPHRFVKQTAVGA